MKLKWRIISVCLVPFTLLSCLFSCGESQDDPETQDSTPAVTDIGSTDEIPGETFENGEIEFKLLGIRTVDTYANITAAEGKSIVCFYVEAINRSLNDYYVLRSCLDTAGAELLHIDEELLPEGYDNFGGYIASGKRRLFLLCFEEKTNWFRMNLSYDAFDEMRWDEIIWGKDHREEKELLADNTAYPLDTRGNDNLKADLEILREKYVGSLWGSPNEAKAETLEALLVESEKGRYFSNIDYEDQNRAKWDTLNHLANLKDLISYYGQERLETDEKARSIVLSLLDYWLAHDFQNPNNYVQIISVPSNLIYCANMIRPYLSEAQIDKINTIVGRGTLRGTSEPAVNYGVVQYAENQTGANLLDCMEITIYHALLLDDVDLALAAVARTTQEVKIMARGAEGMQADGAFFQHGALLCSGGHYGAVYSNKVTVFICNTYGTGFSLPETNINIFIDHLLDGERYFHRVNGANYFSIGRSAATGAGGSDFKTITDMLIKLEGLYRIEELVEYRESFDDKAKFLDSLKYFPSAYSMVNSSPEGYIALRGAHSGFILTEVVNDQNILGYNLSYGANTCYLHYGDEYGYIGGVMDYSMYPGTTTYLESDEQLYARYTSDYKKTWGRETYIGDHCDGLVDEEKKIGALYMELINDGITGKLSFITYDNVLIALGAGLNLSKETSSEIRTTVDQTKFNNAMIGAVPLTVGSGAVTVDKNDVVHNGAFAYYNLGNTVFTAEAKSMTGCIARTYTSGSNVPVTRDVLQLYISHGNDLDNDSYAYAVAANAEGNAPKSVSELKISKITNTPDIQAVEFEDGTAVIIFHKAGEFVLSGGEKVVSDNADIVIK